MKKIPKAFFMGLFVLIGIPISLYVMSAFNYISKCDDVRPSCLDHRKAGCNISGDYSIGSATIKSEVSCDMQSDQGGWTLVANYLHRLGGPGGPTVLASGKFPQQNKKILGLDEVGTESWGNTSAATLSTVPFAEVRFRCQTTAHQRLIDFALTSKSCLDYFRTGQGSCLGSTEEKTELMKSLRELPGNGAKLPLVADKGWKDQGDFALVNYPFFLDYKNHWAVGRLPGRFECDDYDSGGTASTWHQIWIR
ncbi:MAG: hypothetical protein H7235_02285 [Bdellovibrionaceae bacterium]|nr:hypothetical protein [Pseudobdellovibrionaceae bacterium]